MGKGEPQRHRKTSRKGLIAAAGVVGAAAAVYIGFAAYFSGHFYFNTTVNGNDFSGKTPEAAAKYIEEQISGYELVVRGKDGKTDTIRGEDIALKYLQGDSLRNIMKEQSPALWVSALFEKKNIDADIEMQYDTAALERMVGEMDFMKPENQTEPVSAKPVFNGSEFVIEKEVSGTKLDREAFGKALETSIRSFDKELDLEKAGCYVKPKFTEQSKEVTEAKDKMNSYLESTVTYQMGDQPEGIDRAKLAEWVKVDDNMAVTFNTDGIAAFVSDLASRYDSVGKTRTVVTPTGKTATVNGGTYGWSIDEPKEIEQLKADIATGKPVTREPIYEQRAAAFGEQDWGNTYAEVDLSAQYMWYIQNGAVVLETDVVTGFPVPEKITPEGTYYVLYKESPSVLVGAKDPVTGKPEYETEVRYWMQFTWSGVGFHDADWQPAFGGSLYQSVGSHGCVNMPIDKAGQLIGLIEAGVPVLVHY